MTPTPSHVDTDELIETLERLEKEATPGPWTAKRIDYEEYGIDVSFEVNAPRKSPVLQTIMVERHEVASVRADWANCELVTALRNHLPALISALKENKRLREDVRTAQHQTWETAIKCASNAAGLFPKDTDKSLHRFGAETVLRALLHVRAQCLDTAALQPQGEK